MAVCTAFLWTHRNSSTLHRRFNHGGLFTDIWAALASSWVRSGISVPPPAFIVWNMALLSRQICLVQYSTCKFVLLIQIYVHVFSWIWRLLHALLKMQVLTYDVNTDEIIVMKSSFFLHRFDFSTWTAPVSLPDSENPCTIYCFPRSCLTHLML